MPRLLDYFVLASLAFCATTAPALADDDSETEKIGIAVALGLSAADGKATLASGAGAIEASLLESQAINHAGAIIAALAAQAEPEGKILLVNRSETINAAAYYIIKRRIKAIRDDIELAECPKEKDDKQNGEDDNGEQNLVESTSGKKVKPSIGDIVPALATSTSYAAITLSVEDRAILTSILLNAKARFSKTTSSEEKTSPDSSKIIPPYTPPRWQKPDWSTSDKPTAAIFFRTTGDLQGNLTNPPASDSLLADYDAMIRAADSIRYCTDKHAKARAAFSSAETYVTALNATSDKAPVSPLTLAIQQEELVRDGAPSILRVAIEQSGGTSRTDSNIWLTLGFPGAATVSAGLLVSFRLTRSSDGHTLKAGFVRCAVPPASMRSMRRFALSDDDQEAEAKRNNRSLPEIACSYISS